MTTNPETPCSWYLSTVYIQSWAIGWTLGCVNWRSVVKRRDSLNPGPTLWPISVLKLFGYVVSHLYSPLLLDKAVECNYVRYAVYFIVSPCARTVGAIHKLIIAKPPRLFVTVTDRRSAGEPVQLRRTADEFHPLLVCRYVNPDSWVFCLK